MSISLYNRLYSYRQRENKNDRENYLIELFAFSLETNTKFFNELISRLSIDIYDVNSYKINTQASYEVLGRPDVEIFINGDTHILMECKVDSHQGDKQLERYHEILKYVNAENRYLIYITKYFEHLSVNTEVKYKVLRWSDILELISEESTGLLKEFRKYLIEEDMSVKNINLTDVHAMRHIQSTMKKLDEVLDEVGVKFNKMFGGSYQHAMRSTMLQKEGWYGLIKYFEKESGVYLGFGNYDEEELPKLFIEFYCLHNDEKMIKAFKTIKDKLKLYEYEGNYHTYFGVAEPMTKFIDSDSDSIKGMISFFDKELDRIDSVKNQLSDLLNT